MLGHRALCLLLAALVATASGLVRPSALPHVTRQSQVLQLWAAAPDSINRWIASSVAEPKGVCVEAFVKGNGELGMRATRGISKGDVLLSIPIGLCLDAKRARSVFDAASTTLSRLRTGDFGLIALLLLYEKAMGSKSKYDAYIQTLPQTAPGILSWTPAELNELYASSTRQIKSQVDAVEDDWALISNLADINKIATKETFTWALGIVKAKHVFVDNQASLAPVLDLIAFDPFSGAEPYTASAGMFGGKIVKAWADQPFAKGAEVTMSYGLKGSAECVEDHGFCPDVAPADACAELKVNLEESDRWFDDKVDVLEQQGLPPSNRFDIEADPLAPLDAEMLQILRLKSIEGNDGFILEAVFSQTVYKTMQLPFSKVNEIKVFRYLEVRLAQLAALLDSKSTPAQDAALLSSSTSVSSGSDRLATMARLRVQERAAVSGALRNVEANLKLLTTADVNEYYQERRLRDLDLLRPLDEDEIVN